MSDITQGDPQPADADGRDDRRAFLFGSLAIVGASVSLIFCYAQVLISLLAPLFGMAAFEINIHLQAVFMWGFGLLTVFGLARDRLQHRGLGPLVIGVCAVVSIAGTLYLYYDIRILILGYVLLVIAALLNQNMKLATLNREVHAQSRELQALNSTLEGRIESQVGEIERLSRLKRFLSTEVAGLITAEGSESLLNSHRRLIACLFCDVRNFTTFSETVKPEEVMDVLQTVHERMGRLVAAHGGTIGYRAGDGLMIIFNDPLPCDDPVAKAIALARDMERVFRETRDHWQKLGHDLGLGIGIAYGYATLGVIGSEGRYDYTAIGNVVNIAARLCDSAEDGQIYIDKRAQMEVDGEAGTDLVGALELKGIGAPVAAYRIPAPDDAE